MNPLDFDFLIDQYLDGSLTPEKTLELEEKLKNDPVAQDQYIERSRLHAALIWNMKQKPSPVYQKVAISLFSPWALTATLSLVLGFGILFYLTDEPIDENSKAIAIENNIPELLDESYLDESYLDESYLDESYLDESYLEVTKVIDLENIKENTVPGTVKKQPSNLNKSRIKGKTIFLDELNDSKKMIDLNDFKAGDTLIHQGNEPLQLTLLKDGQPNIQLYMHRHNTKLEIISLGKQKHFRLLSGGIDANIGPQPTEHPMLLETPYSMVQVLGTEFRVHTFSTGDKIFLYEGKLEITDNKKKENVFIQSGQFVNIGKRKLTYGDIQPHISRVELVHTQKEEKLSNPKKYDLKKEMNFSLSQTKNPAILYFRSGPDPISGANPTSGPFPMTSVMVKMILPAGHPHGKELNIHLTSDRFLINGEKNFFKWLQHVGSYKLMATPQYNYDGIQRVGKTLTFDIQVK